MTSEFKCLALAYSATETIKFKLLFDNAGIKYIIRNELLQNVLGANVATGPVEFWINQDDYESATIKLIDQLRIYDSQIANFCPACGEVLSAHLLDCPGCGLFLR